MVKSGKQTALEGIYEYQERKLHIKFSYNRTFDGGTKYGAKKAGSWTKALRPDYTLSIWPEEIKHEEQAEREEKIVHIHFDSKYKVQQFIIKTDVDQNLKEIDEESVEEIITSETKIDSLEIEKNEERKGIYKNVDLLKMHAYKDAIRRTGGAYILYPGTEKHTSYNGFHELIPGLGAFAICPKEGENGTAELSDFIDKILEHFNNMASQQRRHSNKIYEIHQNPLDTVNEPMPEYIIPDETSVIIAYYKSIEHFNWIDKKMKYNGRVGTDRGAMELTTSYISANYLVLHNKSNPQIYIYKIDQSHSKKPIIVSSTDELFVSGDPVYPDPSQPFYLVFNLLEKEDYFLNSKFILKNLPDFDKAQKNSLPFTCTLTELLKFAKEK
jgi:hypothetical protein